MSCGYRPQWLNLIILYFNKYVQGELSYFSRLLTSYPCWRAAHIFVARSSEQRCCRPALGMRLCGGASDFNARGNRTPSRTPVSRPTQPEWVPVFDWELSHDGERNWTTFTTKSLPLNNGCRDVPVGYANLANHFGFRFRNLECVIYLQVSCTCRSVFAQKHSSLLMCKLRYSPENCTCIRDVWKSVKLKRCLAVFNQV